MKEIIANTFTPIYDELEDRIRLVINYQDMSNRVDLMITRSLILKLLPLADEFVIKHYGDNNSLDKISISTQKEEEPQENISQTDGVNLELFKTDEQLLHEVNFSYDANTKLTSLNLSSKHTKAIAILNHETLKQVFETIKTSIPNFSWGISSNF